MSNGKVQIIGMILKHYEDRPFKASNLTDLTGLSRQLAHKHLTSLVEDGLIQKAGTSYLVIDKETLLDSLVESVDKASIQTIQSKSTVLTENNVNLVNGTAEGVACLKPFIPAELHQEIKNLYVLKVDTTVKELAHLRKFLNAAERTPRSAARKIKGQIGVTYDSFVNFLGWTPTLTREAFVEMVEKGMEEAE